MKQAEIYMAETTKPNLYQMVQPNSPTVNLYQEIELCSPFQACLKVGDNISKLSLQLALTCQQ